MIVTWLFAVMLVESPALDDRPESVDLEVMEIQNGGHASPRPPSLALTDTDFGGHGEPQTGRSTLLRSGSTLTCLAVMSK